MVAINLRSGLLVLGSVWVAIPTNARAQCCVAADLCPAMVSPCTVSTECDVGPGVCTFDLTGIDVTFTSTGGLNSDGNTWSMLANDLTLESGARLWDSQQMGTAVDLLLTGDYIQHGTVDLRSDDWGGDFTVAADGLIEILDNIWVHGAGYIYASGGSVTLTAGDSIWVDAPMDATGPGKGDGGMIWLWAGSSVTVLKNLLASGGWWGGDVSIDATNDIVLDGNAEVQGTSNGDGGFIWVASSSGNIWTTGQLDAHGSGSQYYGGYWGGDITVIAAGTAEIGNTVNAKGSIPDGDGGAIQIEGTDVTTNALITAVGAGSDSAGGQIDLLGSNSVTVTANVEANGGSFDAGTISVIGGNRVDLYDKLVANAGSGGWGGDIEVTSTTGDVFVDANIEAKNTGGGGDSGTIRIEGCNVEVAAGSIIDTRNNWGSNTLVSRESLLLEGDARAATTNLFLYRQVAPVLVGVVDVPETLMQDPTLVPCGASTTTTSTTQTTGATSTTGTSTGTTGTPPTTGTTATTSTTGTTATTGTTSTTGTTATTGTPGTSPTTGTSTGATGTTTGSTGTSEDKDSGCGCQTGGDPIGWLALLVSWVGVWRRRSVPHGSRT